MEEEEKPRTVLKLPQINKKTSENFSEREGTADRKEN
jgi:hypothetical protein